MPKKPLTSSVMLTLVTAAQKAGLVSVAAWPFLA